MRTATTYRRIVMFDFDGTLFKSWEHTPDWWAEPGQFSFFVRPESLTEPCVPEHPPADYWISHAVAAARAAVSDRNAYVVVITGRVKVHAPRIEQLLAGKGIVPDKMYFNPGMPAATFKTRVLGMLLASHPLVDQIEVWENENQSHYATYLQVAQKVLGREDVVVSVHSVQEQPKPLLCGPQDFDMRTASTPRPGDYVRIHAPTSLRESGVFKVLSIKDGEASLARSTVWEDTAVAMKRPLADLIKAEPSEMDLLGYFYINYLKIVTDRVRGGETFDQSVKRLPNMKAAPKEVRDLLRELVQRDVGPSRAARVAANHALRVAAFPKGIDHTDLYQHVYDTLRDKRMPRWDSFMYGNREIEVFYPDPGKGIAGSLWIRFPGSADTYQWSPRARAWLKARRALPPEEPKTVNPAEQVLDEEEQDFYRQTPEEILAVLKSYPKSMLRGIVLHKDLLPDEVLAFLDSVGYRFRSKTVATPQPPTGWPCKVLDQTADRVYWQAKSGSKTYWLITNYAGVIDHDAPLSGHQQGNYFKKRDGDAAWAQVKSAQRVAARWAARSVQADSDGSYMSVTSLEALSSHARKLQERITNDTSLPDWAEAKITRANADLLDVYEFVEHGGLDRERKQADALPGGIGDQKDVWDFDPRQVNKGIRVEMEHTRDAEVALDIVKDHLTEDPRYYDKLEKIER